jgi:serine kinase of HPr protein (carbohydrate metabolism regulator)
MVSGILEVAGSGDNDIVEISSKTVTFASDTLDKCVAVNNLSEDEYSDVVDNNNEPTICGIKFNDVDKMKENGRVEIVVEIAYG